VRPDWPGFDGCGRKGIEERTVVYGPSVAAARGQKILFVARHYAFANLV
jgi:hypothetical protein